MFDYYLVNDSLFLIKILKNKNNEHDYGYECHIIKIYLKFKKVINDFKADFAYYGDIDESMIQIVNNIVCLHSFTKSTYTPICHLNNIDLDKLDVSLHCFSEPFLGYPVIFFNYKYKTYCIYYNQGKRDVHIVNTSDITDDNTIYYENCHGMFSIFQIPSFYIHDEFLILISEMTCGTTKLIVNLETKEIYPECLSSLTRKEIITNMDVINFRYYNVYNKDKEKNTLIKESNIKDYLNTNVNISDIKYFKYMNNIFCIVINKVDNTVNIYIDILTKYNFIQPINEDESDDYDILGTTNNNYKIPRKILLERSELFKNLYKDMGIKGEANKFISDNYEGIDAYMEYITTGKISDDTIVNLYRICNYIEDVDLNHIANIIMMTSCFENMDLLFKCLIELYDSPYKLQYYNLFAYLMNKFDEDEIEKKIFEYEGSSVHNSLYDMFIEHFNVTYDLENSTGPLSTLLKAVIRKYK